MANSYNTEMVSVATTGSNVLVFAATGDLILRDVQIYAKGGAATVSVLYDDRTIDDVVAKKSMDADEKWHPFAAPIAMRSAHELKVNTSAALTILITYVEFD
jgi:hypothetical protein